MIPQQAKNVLDWVEAMLSGQYKHGAGVLYNPATGCHCALAVGCEVMGQPRDIHGNYFGNSAVSVADTWFEKAFGLPRDASFYAAVSDKSTNFFGVSALLLNAVPNDYKRKKDLDKQLQAAVAASLSEVFV